MRLAGDPFDHVRRALDATGVDRLDLWLRDDDAVATTAQLERFKSQCLSGGAAPLFAVIPGRVTVSLEADARTWPETWKVAVHGWQHENRAASHAKKSEFPDTRDCAAVREDLANARARLSQAFGSIMLPVFVPPWNRIGSSVAQELAAAGYTGLSTFARAHIDSSPAGVKVLNTQVDVIDWRGGRIGKPVELIAEELSAAVFAGTLPIGILTHHLDHDETAVRALDALLDFATSEPRVQWQLPADLFS